MQVDALAVRFQPLPEHSFETSTHTPSTTVEPFEILQKDIAAESLAELKRLAELLIRDRQTAFLYPSGPRTDLLRTTPQLDAIPDQLGRYLLNRQPLPFLRFDVCDIRKYFPCYRSCPYLACAVDALAYAQERASEWRALFSSELRGAALNRAVSRLATQALVMEIRRLSKLEDCHEFLKRLTKVQRQRYRSVERYFSTIFRKHSRIVAVRVDLAYNRLIDGIAVAPPDYAQVVEHRNSLIGLLQSRFGKSMLGYVLKLEHGLRTGLHYHLLLMMDGRLITNDAIIALMVGRIWELEVTAGRGRQYNCNAARLANPDIYRGIGCIHRDDAVRRGELLKATNYLCKFDGLIAHHVEAGTRTFFRGEVPRGGTRKH